jgi:hypothetical protein
MLFWRHSHFLKKRAMWFQTSTSILTVLLVYLEPKINFKHVFEHFSLVPQVWFIEYKANSSSIKAGTFISNKVPFGFKSWFIHFLMWNHIFLFYFAKVNLSPLIFFLQEKKKMDSKRCFFKRFTWAIGVLVLHSISVPERGGFVPY